MYATNNFSKSFGFRHTCQIQSEPFCHALLIFLSLLRKLCILYLAVCERQHAAVEESIQLKEEPLDSLESGKPKGCCT